MFRKYSKYLNLRKLQHTSAFSKINIEIPIKIERSPTDLLKALESKLIKDYTAPDNKYHDDPYLIPVNNIEKRTFSLSKESGRMAARYFLDRYPTLFEDYKDYPKIEQFYSTSPQLQKAMKMELCEDKLETLMKLEANFDIIFNTYKELKNAGQPISHPTQLLLLQLFCFNNSSDPSIHDLVDESHENKDVQIQPGDDMYWYKNVTGLKPYKARWKDMGYADQIWEDLEPKDGLAYSTMIKGLAKYLKFDKAKALYEDMIAYNIPIDVDVYDSLLSLIPYQVDNVDLQWITAKTYMAEMAKNSIQPTLKTFNYALAIAVRIRNYRQSSQLALQILAEMNACGINPSLATFDSILKGHYRDRSSYHTIIYDITEYLKNKELSIQDPKDVDFFPTAMAVCRNNIRDTTLAGQLVEIYGTRNNRLLIGDHDNHHNFFSNYFRILTQHDSLDGVIAAYDKYVPNEFCVDFPMARELLRSVNRSLTTTSDEGPTGTNFLALLEFVPRLWSDFKIFAIMIVNKRENSKGGGGQPATQNYNTDSDYFKEFLRIMVLTMRHMPAPVSLENSEQTTQCEKLVEAKHRFGKMAQEIITNFDGKNENNIRGIDDKLKNTSEKISGHGSNDHFVASQLVGMFNDIVVVFYHARLFDDIWALIRRFQVFEIVEEMSAHTLEKLIKLALTMNDNSSTMMCFKIATTTLANNTHDLYNLILKSYSANEADSQNENVSGSFALTPKDRVLMENWLQDYEIRKKSAKAKHTSPLENSDELSSSSDALK